jgi:CBS domain-containing protein
MIVRLPRATDAPQRLTRSASVMDAARLMLREDVDELPVVDGEDVVGVVTERDLVAKVMARELDPARTLIADVCSTAR